MFIASFSLQSEQQLMVSRDTRLNTSCYIAVMDQYHALFTPASRQAFTRCGKDRQSMNGTVGPFSRATWCSILLQFTGRGLLVQLSYWPENTIDWLG